MTVVIIGEISSHGNTTLFIKDNFSYEIHEVFTNDDETFELKVGSTGIFIGEFLKGKITVIKYELRKFLDPLYEEDLLGEAGKIIMELINDPFPEIFKKKFEELNES